MRIVQPIEVFALSIFTALSIATWYVSSDLVLSLLVAIIGLLITILMVCWRTVSYIIAFLTEVAPSFSVVREFLKKFGS
jgi:hypothetical protein